MTEAQIIIIVAIVVLTILATIIGIQVSLTFRGLKRVVERMEKVIGNLQIISSTMIHPNPDSDKSEFHLFAPRPKNERKGVKLQLKKPSISFGKRFFKRKSA